MKKIGILNNEISKVISELGHTDTIVICDSGLPIPSHVKRIDLALKRGLPSFIDCLTTVLEEMQVERAYFAREMNESNPQLKDRMAQELKEAELCEISHEQLKQLSHEAKAVIRTGECTPYANVILQAGVIF
jgi:D-ribose pyranase